MTIRRKEKTLVVYARASQRKEVRSEQVRDLARWIRDNLRTGEIFRHENVISGNTYSKILSYAQKRYRLNDRETKELSDAALARLRKLGEMSKPLKH